MLLAASLSRSTLGDILGQLHRARASGVLVLSETVGDRAGVEHAVHLIGGAPRAVASDGPRIGELLAERRLLDRERLAEAVRRKRRGDDRLFGEVVCALGSDADAVNDALEQQTRARLEPLYALSEAKVRFHAALFESVAPRAWVRAARTARSLSPVDFLHGRRRAKMREQGETNERRELLRMLQLGLEADEKTMREAFKRRVHELHPDRAGEMDRAQRTKDLSRLLSLYQRITG
ncbi:MAG: hypothetical protein HOW73_18370 [Polyangiaceae bacterium]|nr:hypothetical protein [Polyangiaceae bacterium]